MGRFIKKIFSIRNSLFFFILASLCSISTHLLCMRCVAFREWFRHPGLSEALYFKILLLLLWLCSLISLGMHFYWYNWKTNLVLLLQVFCILLITLVLFFVG